MDGTITLFLCGDVMTGRGIDQVLPRPGNPRIHEDYVGDAREYVHLAEAANGPVPRPVGYDYVWGDALRELELARPCARIINLETSITRSEDYWKGKGINYRMEPANIPVLSALRPDVCVLANNHVLDYGYSGLRETLDTLRNAGFRTAGAGLNLAEASQPAPIGLAGGRSVVVLGFGTPTSGIPPAWAATATRPGVNLLQDLSKDTIRSVRGQIERLKGTGHVVVVSIHWGNNWGYEVPDAHVEFAHHLVDAGADIVHGHSSHHVRPIEIYGNRLVLYGCGDFISDYEGISGYETFRDDLSVMYLPSVDAESGALRALAMAPFELKRLQLTRASPGDARWLQETIGSISERFSTGVAIAPDARIVIER